MPVPFLVCQTIIQRHWSEVVIALVADFIAAGVTPCRNKGVCHGFHVFVADKVDGTIRVGIIVGRGRHATVRKVGSFVWYSGSDHCLTAPVKAEMVSTIVAERAIASIIARSLAPRGKNQEEVCESARPAVDRQCFHNLVLNLLIV